MPLIFTIGHSTLELAKFIQILLHNKIKCLVDVRSYPSSRAFPQYNKDNLAKSLSIFGITYIHIASLGGRRNFPNIHHPALTSKSFSSYAEYMIGPEFKKGIKDLKKIARGCRTAIMCSEAVWWRCFLKHRVTDG